MKKKLFESLDKLTQIDEMNVTGNLDGGAGPPKSPHIFSKSEEEDENDNAEVFDYKKSKKTRKNFVKEFNWPKSNLSPSFVTHLKPELDKEFKGRMIYGVGDYIYVDDKKTLKVSGNDSVNSIVRKLKKVLGESKSDFMRMAETLYLDEVTYRDYKADDSMSPKQKVNNAIKEVNRTLFELERTVNRNLKLKNEMGVDSGQYWKSTQSRMKKISERMLKIARSMRDIGA